MTCTYNTHQIHEVGARLGRAHARHHLLPVCQANVHGVSGAQRAAQGSGALPGHAKSCGGMGGGTCEGTAECRRRGGWGRGWSSGAVDHAASSAPGARASRPARRRPRRWRRLARRGDSESKKRLAGSRFCEPCVRVMGCVTSIWRARTTSACRANSSRAEMKEADWKTVAMGEQTLPPGVGLLPEEDLGREVLLVDRVGVGAEDAVLPAVVGLAHVHEGELALADVGHDGDEVDGLGRLRGGGPLGRALPSTGPSRWRSAAWRRAPRRRRAGRAAVAQRVGLGAHLALRGHLPCPG